MAGLVAKKAHGHKEWCMGSTGRWKFLPKQHLVQEGMRGRKNGPKNPHTLHAIKDKHQPIRTAKSNNARAAEIVWRLERNKFRQSGACIKGQDIPYLYPANTWEVGHGSRYSEGVVWWWGEEGVYSGVPAQVSLGEMSCWDGISHKRGKYGLGPLDACHRGRWWCSLILI